MACGRLPSRSRRSDGPACRLRGAGRRGARAAGDGVQGAKRVNKNLKGRAVEAGLGRGRRPPSGTAMRSTSLPPGRAMRIRHSQICPRPLSRQERWRQEAMLKRIPVAARVKMQRDALWRPGRSVRVAGCPCNRLKPKYICGFQSPGSMFLGVVSPSGIVPNGKHREDRLVRHARHLPARA